MAERALDAGSSGAVTHVLRCVLCGRTYGPTYGAATCPEHAGVGGMLDVEWLEPSAGRPPQAAGQASAPGRPSHRLVSGEPVLPAGYLVRTPLVEAPRLAADLGVARLRVKDEGRNPTGSLKDRSSALAVELALQQGYGIVACASTGNAASSLAGACATVGLAAIIFVPVRTPVSKLAQLAAFGAHVLLVEGTYDDAWYLCEAAVREFGWYNRNCAVNPYLIEGKKTCGWEIAEDVGDDPVDWLSVAVGDGCTVSAMHKGLEEMRRRGAMSVTPRLLAVQPSGAAPIVRAFDAGVEDIEEMIPNTMADSISVGRPRNAVKALRAVASSGGTAIAVSDDEILEAQRALGRLGGLYAEPGAAAGIAGIRSARRQGLIGADARLVHVITGSGLKSTPTLDELPAYPRIAPSSLEAVRAAVLSAGGQVAAGS